MDGKKTAQELADAFAVVDKARNLAEKELIKAANQAFGADVFNKASFFRDSSGVIFTLSAKIPVENPSGFWDGLGY